MLNPEWMLMNAYTHRTKLDLLSTLTTMGCGGELGVFMG